MKYKENVVRKYLSRKCKENSFQLRATQWVVRRDCPDTRVLGYCWVEAKRPGETPRPTQLREFRIMREQGEDVRVIDTKEGVDELINELIIVRENGRTKIHNTGGR